VILLMNLVVFCENFPLKSVSGTSKILNNTVNLWINYGYLKLSKEMVSWEQGELRELEHMIYFWKPVLLKKINLISEKGTFLRWTLFTTFAIKVQMLCTIKCFSKCIQYRIFYRLIMFIRIVTKNEQWRGTQGLFKLPDNSILFYRTKKIVFII